MVKPSVSLNYTIISCTSEDSSHPISSILKSSINSTGWQSTPNSHYPIEFIVDLSSLVELDTLQFVSHQYKIASRLDLYVAGSDKKYKGLGSLVFNANGHSQYSVRELKSATCNGIKAQYIKVSIPGCFANPNNTGNQVGIVSFNVIGRGGFERTSYGGSNNAGNSDGSDMLELLERQKREAVQKEDFKKAELLKRQIDRLRRAYDQIVVLQKQKREAVEREDYGAAQKIKSDIDMLLNGGNEQVSRYSSNIQQFGNQIQKQNNYQSKQQQFSTTIRRGVQPTFADPIEEPDPVIRQPQPAKSSEPHDMPAENIPIRKRRVSPKKDDEHEAPTQPPVNATGPNRRRPKNADTSSFEAPAREKISNNPPRRMSVDPDERKINQGGGSKEPPGKATLSTEPDELTAGRKAEAGCLMDLFPENIIACFFSKPWNLKVDGINKLADLISGLKSQQGDAFYRYCYINRHRVQEEHKVVYFASLDGIKKIGNSLKLSKNDFERGITQILPHLQSKIGHSQAALSDHTCKFLLWVYEQGCAELVMPMLLKTSGKPQQWKIPFAQIRVLHKIIVTKGEINTIPGLSVDLLMNFLVPHLESASKEVRDSAIDAVVTVEAIAGSIIYRYIEKVQSRVKAAIEERIRKARDE